MTNTECAEHEKTFLIPVSNEFIYVDVWVCLLA